MELLEGYFELLKVRYFPLVSAQWRSQRNSKGGARQQEKTLAFTNNFSASYAPPGIFYPRGVPEHLGHPHGYALFLGRPMWTFADKNIWLKRTRDIISYQLRPIFDFMCRIIKNYAIR